MLNDYYLNKELVTKLEKRKKVQLIVGGIFAPTTFLLILESIFHFGFLDASDTYELSELPVIAIVLAGFCYLLWCGLRNKDHLLKASIYNDIFEEDVNGTVTLDELQTQTKKNRDTIKNELKVLFKRQLFTNCSLQNHGGIFQVVLDTANKANKGSFDFITVTCPSCGATSRVRQGSAGKCDYCDGPLHG